MANAFKGARLNSPAKLANQTDIASVPVAFISVQG
jgi:hypothetical protein